jgi:hypothetical protein
MAMKADHNSAAGLLLVGPIRARYFRIIFFYVDT